MKARRIHATITVQRATGPVRILVAAEMPAVPRSAIDFREVSALDLDTGEPWDTAGGWALRYLTVGECHEAQQALDCALAEQLRGLRTLDDAGRRIAATLGWTAAEVRAVRS